MKESITVYMVFMDTSGHWHPVPFATRAAAEKWAEETFKTATCTIHGYRVRN